MSAHSMTADDVAKMLNLQPHPEGGAFRETFRDTQMDATSRAASTAIYFLLRQGEYSRWHRVDAAEGWHAYAGAPLLLETIGEDGALIAVRLGCDLAAGERPQYVVAAGVWQRAKSLGDWSLAGCTVAPGFSFAGFELAADDFDPSNNVDGV